VRRAYMDTENILEPLLNSIVTGDPSQAKEEARKALEQGIPPLDVLEHGMVAAMRVVGDKWETFEIFLPEVLLAINAWQAAMNIVDPMLSKEERADAIKGKVVIGTVKGDVHDIGKNIVSSLLKTAGFEVFDVGHDAPASVFITEAERVQANIIALSALMTTTMPYQRDVLEYLETRGIRDQYFVMVGGGAVTQEWADNIGADAYGETAEDAARLALGHVDSQQKKA
jgi:corrinoid protein of di/trimethylamine methyltransferase